MSSLEITITDELSSRLAEAAKQSGKNENELVVALLEKAFLQRTSFHEALKAMFRGEKPGKKLDIAAILKKSPPHFKTVEDALQYSRKYK